MKKLTLFALLVTSASVLASPAPPTYSVPDAGSTALLLLAAGGAVAVAKRFRK